MAIRPTKIYNDYKKRYNQISKKGSKTNNKKSWKVIKIGGLITVVIVGSYFLFFKKKKPANKQIESNLLNEDLSYTDTSPEM